MKHNKKPQRSLLKRFAKDEQGGVLIIFGLSAVFLVAIGGAGVDLGLQQLMQVKLQNSVDAAVTSAGSLSSCKQRITGPIREQAAKRYFKLNYPANFLDYGKAYETGEMNRPKLEVSFADDNIYGVARDNLATHFVNNFGKTRLNGYANSGASISDTYLDTDFDAAMVIDESGSMIADSTAANPYVPPDYSGNTPPTPFPATLGNPSSSRQEAARRAFTVFAKTAFPDCIPNPNVRMGMVGFSGFLSNKWALSSDRTYVMGIPQNIFAKGRNIEEIGIRAGTNMLDIVTNSSPALPAYSGGGYSPGWYYPGQGWNEATQTTIDPKWTDNQAHPEDFGYPHTYTLPASNGASNERRGLVHPVSTNLPGERWYNPQRLAGNQGYTGEGFLDLSVDFDTTVPLPLTERDPSINPSLHGPKASLKYMIFMSDGSVATDSSSGFLDARAMQDECARADAKGIKVFTINFTSQNPDDEPKIKNCASINPQTGQKEYYYAPNEDELKKILKNIIRTIRKTRIVE